MRCPFCGAKVRADALDCPSCQTPLDTEDDTHVDGPPRRQLGVPWGLLIVLGIYFLSVLGISEYQKRTSPTYQAALHVREAMKVLGKDGGETAPTDELFGALDHLIKALGHLPEDLWCHDRVEQVARRLVERRVAIPRETQRTLDALANRYRQAREAKHFFAPIGPRDVWDFDAATRGPAKVLQWSLAGAGLIIALWLYAALGSRKRLEALAQERRQERRKDVARLGDFRRRG